MNSSILNFPLHRHLESSLLGQFIGHEGGNIYRIERENRVTLEILPEKNQKNILKITGPYWNLKCALNDVKVLISTIHSENQRYSFKIPEKDVGFLIGKNGAKINEIKLKSSVDVHLDNKNVDEEVKVTVKGNYQQIITGLRLIYERLTSKGQKSVYDDPRSRQFIENLLESF